MKTINSQVFTEEHQQDKFLQKFLSFIRKESLLAPKEKVLLAVSGGLDSSVLAYLFKRAQKILNIEIALVHVDHAVRGLSSEREADWIRALGDRLDLRVHSLKLSSTEDIQSQEKLRNERRRMLVDLAKTVGAHKISTAHHADDNAETFLMRAISGTGIAGLRGMAPLNDQFVKPLLWATRDELLQIARKKSLPWVEDPSNQSKKYLRNKLRLEALPLLEKIRPASKRNLSRLVERISTEEKEMDAWLSLQLKTKNHLIDLKWLATFPQSLQRRVIRLWLHRNQLFASPQLVEALLNGQELIHKAGSFLRHNGFLIFHREKSFGSIWKSPQPLSLNKRFFLGDSLSWSFLPDSPRKLRPYDLSIYLCLRQAHLVANSELSFDWDLCPDELCIRNIQKREMESFQAVFKEMKIPQPFWAYWPVLANARDSDELVALIGLRVLKKFRYQGIGRCVVLESFFEESLGL